jgi:hypothetical protein
MSRDRSNASFGRVEEKQAAMSFFPRRHEAIHIGETRANPGHVGQEEGKPVFEYFFSLGWQHAEPIEVDVLSACEHTHDAISTTVTGRS